jgi:predicted nucleotidyltransferase
MGAADFLFTPSVQRILAATLRCPERAFTLQELLALAASGRGSIQLQIERLLSAGVLKEEPRRGRQRSIRANTSHFLFPELCSIARKTFGLADPLQEALRPFSTLIDEAFVFGSAAKGTDTAGSDIDLAVIGSVAMVALSEAIYKVEQQLGRPIQLSLYDAQEWQHLVAHDPIVGQIAQGPKLSLWPHVQTA